MATADPDDDDGVDPEDRDDELPLDDVLLLVPVAEPPVAVLLLVAVLLVAVVLWCVEAGRAAAIPATPMTLAMPTPAVAAATFLFPRRLAA